MYLAGTHLITLSLDFLSTCRLNTLNQHFTDDKCIAHKATFSLSRVHNDETWFPSGSLHEIQSR